MTRTSSKRYVVVFLALSWLLYNFSVGLPNIMFLSMQPRTVMSGRGATMTAVTRTMKRAVMRRIGLTTVEEEMGSDVMITGHQNLLLTCLTYYQNNKIFVGPNTNNHKPTKFLLSLSISL